MRLRILTRPAETVAGFSPEHFDVGGVYDIRAHVACVYLAKGWGEAVSGQAANDMVHPSPDAHVQINAVVLVFEDEAAQRRFTQQLLTYRGYHVVLTRHGEEAIERLDQQCRGVTVLDATTFIGSGSPSHVNQLYLTHARVSATPVLLRADDDSAMVAAASVEAMAVVKIPFDPEALLEALA